MSEKTFLPATILKSIEARCLAVQGRPNRTLYQNTEGMRLPHPSVFSGKTSKGALDLQMKNVVNDRCQRRRLSEKTVDNLFGYSLLLPTFLVFALVILFPIVKGIAMSFYDYTFLTIKKGPKWNHFQNYITIFQEGFPAQLGRTLLFTVGTVGLELVIGMCIALLLNTNIKGRSAFRSLYLMSWTIPSIVTALLWSWLFNAQYGIIDYALSKLRLISDPNMQWLLSPERAMISVIIAVVWRQTPYMLVMLLAGLQSINMDLVEAAAIDGANTFQTFFRVKLPSIKTVIGNTVITCVMSSFQQFTIIRNMTQGGPLDKTMTMSLATYRIAFTNMNLGAGAAIGVVWMLILGTGITLYNHFSRRFDEI